MKLQSGTFLQGGKYRIESVLGQGGFGITYLGWQTGLERRVAIKEFFMKEYCNRDANTSHVTVGTEGSRELVTRFRQKFIKEAQTIAHLDHPHVVRIYDVFTENDTAYYVMEYIEGGSLQKYISENGALQEQEALFYIRKVAAALEYIHDRQMNHLDVKPDNILRRENAEVVLIDFGLSKRYDESGLQTSTTPVGVSAGYAPMEQYKRGGVGTFSPATDIYSLGGTFYKLLTGQTPPDANDIFDRGLPSLPSGISASAEKAIRAAMQPKRSDRPQSIREFLGLLDGKEEGEDTILIDDKKAEFKQDEALVVEKKKKEKSNKKFFSRKISLIVGGIGLVAAVLGFIFGQGNILNKETQAETTTVVEFIPGELIDLGLSVKWSSYNVGASSAEDYGGLYGWADPTGEKRSKDNNDYPSSTPPANISGTQYDIARSKWGGSWRLPTQKEFQELSDRCDWKWISSKGVNGYLVTGPNGNSIFLPAAGCRYGDGGADGRGSGGYYWSGALKSGGFAYSLNFGSGYRYPSYCSNRCYGLSVRPVSE